MPEPLTPDPVDPFDPAAIDPETAAFNARLAAMLADLPPVSEVPVETTRRARAEGRSIFRIAGPLDGSDWVEEGGVRLRRSPPHGTPRGSYLHIHGGGWTFGAPEQFDFYNQRIARETGLEVFAARYRLAPEHAFPAQIEDVEAAARAVLARTEGPLVIGGESAGGHLAALVALRLRDAGLIGRVAGVVLNYGMFDLAMTPSARRWGPRYLVLSTPVIDWFCTNLAQGRIARDDPALSPLHADLAGLPPALFQCGTLDPLLDDTLFMAARWQVAGNRVETALWPGGVHGFDLFEQPLAAEGFARQDSWVNALLR